MKKILSLLIALVMVMSLAACSGEESAPETKKDDAKKTTEEKTEEKTEAKKEGGIIYDGTLGPIVDSDESVELVFWAHQNGPAVIEEGDAFANWYEEKTGVKFIGTANKNLPPNEDLNMHAADGFPSDLLYSAHDYALMEKYARQGAFVNLYDYLDYMPNLKRLIEEDELFAKMIEMGETGNGELFLVAGTSNFAPTHVPMFRQEYLDAINNGAVPQTIPEVEAYLIAIKAAHANGDLEKFGVPADMEFYPFAFKGWGAWQTLPQQFGAYAEARSTSRILMKDDESGYFIGMNQDAFKEYVRTLSKWYDMGLVHPDFWGLGDEKSLFATGQSAMIIRQAHDAEGLHNPEENITITPALQFGDAGRVRMDTRHSYFVTNGRIGVSTRSENKELAAAVLDSLLIEEVAWASVWGQEGDYIENVGEYFGKQTYKRTAAFEEIVANEYEGNLGDAMSEEGYILNLISNITGNKNRIMGQSENPEELSFRENFKQMYIDAFNADPSDPNYVKTYTGYKPQMTDEEIAESAGLLQALKSHQEAQVQKLINGDADEITDAVWAEFVADSDEIAGKRLVEIYDGALNRTK